MFLVSYVRFYGYHFYLFSFHGNYNAAYGGQSGDAFLALTGGCSEYIDFDDALQADADGSKMEKALQLHRRLKNACKQEYCMLATEVPVGYHFTNMSNKTIDHNPVLCNLFIYQTVYMTMSIWIPWKTEKRL